MTEKKILNDKPVNVLIAAEYRAPRSGNFIASLLDLAETLRDQGGKVAFLFPAQEDRPWAAWLREHSFPVHFLQDQLSKDEKLSEVKKLVNEYGINLIHIHFGYLEGLLLPTHENLGVELIIHDHFDFVTTLGQARQRLTTMRRAMLYRRYHAYCVCVMEKKNRWYWPMGKNRHWFIINGLSSRRAEQDPLSREERREEIGLKQDEKLVLFLGWDMIRKGLDVAIKGVEEYRKTDPSLKLGVIGVGSDGKPSERAEEFLRSKGIDPYTEAVIYMHSYEDIFALNRAVDCYISSSRAEAFGYGILEAISQNTPVVVSDIKGTSWCWDYSKCFRYSVEDPEDCARAIRKALSAGRVPSNFEEFTTQYGNENWCDKVLEVYCWATE